MLPPIPKLSGLKPVLKILAALSCIWIAQGCTYYYTQNAHIRGPLSQAIPGVAENHPHKIRVRPFAYFNPGESMAFNDGQHTRVDSDGNYTVEPLQGDPVEPDPNHYPFRGNNIHWKYEQSASGVDLEFQPARHWILRYGISRAEVGGSVHWSHRLGWGMTGTLGNRIGVRADVGITRFTNRFDVEMVREDLESVGSFNSRDKGLMYNKKGMHSYWGTDGMVTFSTLFSKSALNYFLTLQGGVTPYWANAHEYLGWAGGLSWGVTDRIRFIGGVAGRRYFGTYSLNFDAEYAAQPGVIPFLAAEHAFSAFSFREAR
jgi:hypothetical protein